MSQDMDDLRQLLIRTKDSIERCQQDTQEFLTAFTDKPAIQNNGKLPDLTEYIKYNKARQQNGNPLRKSIQPGVVSNHLTANLENDDPNSQAKETILRK